MRNQARTKAAGPKSAERSLKAELERCRELLDRQGWALVESAVLGDTVVFARDGAEGLPEGRVVYTLSELRHMTERGYRADDLRALHRAKKLFGGTVVDGFEAGIPGSPFPPDPRPDLKEDSRLWEELFTRAWAVSPAAQAALLEARRRGTRLRRRGDGFVLRPQVGEGAWPSADDYMKFRERRLVRHAEAIKQALERLAERRNCVGESGDRAAATELQQAGEV